MEIHNNTSCIRQCSTGDDTNGTNITVQARYNLKIPNASRQALEANILPSFEHSLLSVGQLCNDDSTTIFSKHKCTMYNKQNKTVSSHTSEITPTDYMNNRCQHTNITTSTRQMPHYQHPVENPNTRLLLISCSQGILSSSSFSCYRLLRLLVYMYLSQLMRTFTNYLKCIVISS